MFQMFQRRALSKGTLLLTIALSLGLSGCQSSGSPSAGTASSGPSASSTASASPGASASSAPGASESPSAAPSEQPGDGGGASASPVPAGTPAPSVSMGTVTALRLADAKSGWAGGEGWIARTDNGGSDWTVQHSGSFTVKQLFALNGDKVWATLDAGGGKGLRLIGSADGGKHWNSIGTVPNEGFLHFTSDRTAFSGNAMTTDGGKTWTKLGVPDGVVGDVYFHDANNGWAVQEAKGEYRFLHSSDKGRTWQTVMKRTSEVSPLGSVIRSTGKNDAWIEVVGGSGMTQTSYALFHTSDGGKSWLPAIVKHGAGSGPAPGFSMEDGKYPSGTGAGPGDLYVVNPQTAIIGGQCQACDKPNTIAETTDGGKSWAASKSEFAGYGDQFIAATDAQHIWLVATDAAEPSVLYTTSDGGKSWKKARTFAKPGA
ncbi:WD40/YVTN/BNR-like repeat-containing protein [Cohnella thermotolerans]|uniref:WD40/YVTN/BNR-like repeat-containing protein n=1 Tax=Cohnella thermotolerans TaxID=329858 RepID=UPI0012EC0442|nr:hypothetical protein [Cohnella thermotolerans]